MTDKSTKSKPDGENSSARLSPQAKFNPAFDAWLENKLHKIFDTASQEPIPDELMQLLQKIDDADPAKKKP